MDSLFGAIYMRQEHRTQIHDPSLAESLSWSPGTGQDGRAASKARSAPGSSESLTAKMLEYRSWWNLPRSKPGKAHP